MKGPPSPKPKVKQRPKIQVQRLLIDFETTGLLQPSAAPIEQQPYITEIYACKIDDEFNVVDEFETLVKPPISIPEEVVKITNITDDDVKGAPEFADVYPDLAAFFVGVDIMVAHNAPFDARDLYYELVRLEKEMNFPWPPTHHCTIEMSMHLKGVRLKLSELYELATGETILTGLHRAKNDVEFMLACYQWLLTKGE